MHRRTWRLLFLAVAEYQAMGNAVRTETARDADTSTSPVIESGVGWLALVRQARGVQLEEQEHEG